MLDFDRSSFHHELKDLEVVVWALLEGHVVLIEDFVEEGQEKLVLDDPFLDVLFDVVVVVVPVVVVIVEGGADGAVVADSWLLEEVVQGLRGGFGVHEFHGR